MWELPKVITINNKDYKITDDCDYRMVLDCWKSLKNDELTTTEKLTEALFIFFREDFEEIATLGAEGCVEATEQMFEIINGDRGAASSNRPLLKPMVDFEKDFPLIVSALLTILGYDIREKNYLHWWTFLSAFREIKEGVYSEVLQIRLKQAKGIALSKEEQKFFLDNSNIVNIDSELTDDDKEYLYSD